MPNGLSDNERAIIVYALQALLDQPDAEGRPPRDEVEHLLARAHRPDFPQSAIQNFVTGPTSGQITQIAGNIQGGLHFS